MLPNPQDILLRLRELQRRVRDAVVQSRHAAADLSSVTRTSSADTIYAIDAAIEPIIESYCEDWSRELPMVLIAEGIEPETGRTFPAGLREEDTLVRIIMDPIDGTRGLMYDKRAAWSLAGVAPNKGPATRLSDIEIAVMTELPTTKMGFSDVLWAIKGEGAKGARESISAPTVNVKHEDMKHDEADSPCNPQSAARPSSPKSIRNPQSPSHPSSFILHPSSSPTLAHGFASITKFFPGTKILASKLMEHIVLHLLGPADVKKAMIFDDQYISTGGQLYELIVGHDRFNADLRPHFYRMQNQSEGLCCHPYDCCTALIATEAGVILTDGLGNPLDGPLDVTTGLAWAGYANHRLRQSIEPLVKAFLSTCHS